MGLGNEIAYIQGTLLWLVRKAERAGGRVHGFVPLWRSKRMECPVT